MRRCNETLPQNFLSFLIQQTAVRPRCTSKYKYVANRPAVGPAISQQRRIRARHTLAERLREPREAGMDDERSSLMQVDPCPAVRRRPCICVRPLRSFFCRPSTVYCRLDMPAQAVSAASCWVLDPHSWLARITQLHRGWSLEQPASHFTSRRLFIAAKDWWSEERRCRLAAIRWD